MNGYGPVVQQSKRKTMAANMVVAEYIMSFSAAGLLRCECAKLAGLYLDSRDWSEVGRLALSHNVLQARTLSTAKRISRELLARLRLLTLEEMQILVDGTVLDQGHILWVGVCKRYRFVHEFAVEVIRDKFLRFELELTREDYDAFFNDKAEWHDELERLSELTQNKLRQVLFRMLREADLLSSHDTINPVVLSPRLVKTVHADSPGYLTIFPVSDLDIKEWMK